MLPSTLLSRGSPRPDLQIYRLHSLAVKVQWPSVPGHILPLPDDSCQSSIFHMWEPRRNQMTLMYSLLNFTSLGNILKFFKGMDILKATSLVLWAFKVIRTSRVLLRKGACKTQWDVFYILKNFGIFSYIWWGVVGMGPKPKYEIHLCFNHSLYTYSKDSYS